MDNALGCLPRPEQRTRQARFGRLLLTVFVTFSLTGVPLSSATADDRGTANKAKQRGVAGYEVVFSTTPEPVPPGARFGWLAMCPEGKRAFGGGFTVGDAFNLSPQLRVLDNMPAFNVEGVEEGAFWRVEVINEGPAASFFTVYAVCALVPDERK